ncbi:MAG: alpha-N-acetylglucosaminidase, partial [Candidatus Omnitrophica bacterium]|nr:alpha-N-acetylglucosaminidase [Candidatus Omnitrophota bacterium]
MTWFNNEVSPVWPALTRHCTLVLWATTLVYACLGLYMEAAEGEQSCSRGDNLDAARELIARIVPQRAELFSVEQIPADQGRDVFEIESRGGKVVLRGNSGVAVGAALNWYLKYYCHCFFSLKARQMNIPNPFPEVQPKVRHVSQDRWRYFLNYCCFGYSLPWFDWAQWQGLIDWMALNGINAPLSVTGEEAVWRAAGKRLGFSEADMA